jgi:hypothetical protein
MRANFVPAAVIVVPEPLIRGSSQFPWQQLRDFVLFCRNPRLRHRRCQLLAWAAEQTPTLSVPLRLAKLLLSIPSLSASDDEESGVWSDAELLTTFLAPSH